jgi:hypothetical protein
MTETSVQEAPKRVVTLTPKQRKLLMMDGPFRVHKVHPQAKGKEPKFTLINPAWKGTLGKVADELLAMKATTGEDYVIENPRTTQLVWASVGVQKAK